MRSLRIGMAALAVVALGGCAPVAFAGGSTGWFSGSRSGVQFSTCSGLVAESPEAARLGIRSPAIQMGSLRNRISQIQSRMSFGYTAASSIESWKGAASGDC